MSGERPRRIQRRRTNGWRMPEGAVYVGRPSRWGNPYRVGMLVADPVNQWNPIASLHSPTVLDRGEHYRIGYDGTRYIQRVYVILDRSTAVDLFRRLYEFEKFNVSELRGRDLVCWCPLDQPCHADVLLKLANR